MFAARVGASLKHLLHGRRSSSLSRNCEIVASSRRLLLDSDGGGTLTSLRVTGNGLRTKIFHRGIHISSSPQCESDVGGKSHTTVDDFFSELGSVQKDQNTVVELLTKKPESFQVEKSQKKIATKKIKKNKKTDLVAKPKLLTEKPEASWKTNGKSKAETHARNVKDSFSKPTETSSPIPDHESKAPSIISPSSQAQNETSSNGSSISDTPSKHPSSVLVVRVSNLNSKTTDSKIHARCLSIGSLEGLARVSEDSVDVLFRARNMNEGNSILEKLNSATVDHSQWTAEIVPEAEEAYRDQKGMRIISSFEDMKKQLMMRQILVKDLEVLVHSVLHLENHPMTLEGKL